MVTFFPIIFGPIWFYLTFFFVYFIYFLMGWGKRVLVGNYSDLSSSYVFRIKLVCLAKCASLDSSGGFLFEVSKVICFV